jgi:hypothetical protein
MACSPATPAPGTTSAAGRCRRIMLSGKKRRASRRRRSRSTAGVERRAVARPSTGRGDPRDQARRVGGDPASRAPTAPLGGGRREGIAVAPALSAAMALQPQVAAGPRRRRRLDEGPRVKGSTPRRAYSRRVQGGSPSPQPWPIVPESGELLRPFRPVPRVTRPHGSLGHCDLHPGEPGISPPSHPSGPSPGGLQACFPWRSIVHGQMGRENPLQTPSGRRGLSARSANSSHRVRSREGGRPGPRRQGSTPRGLRRSTVRAGPVGVEEPHPAGDVLRMADSRGGDVCAEPLAGHRYAGPVGRSPGTIAQPGQLPWRRSSGNRRPIHRRSCAGGVREAPPPATAASKEVRRRAARPGHSRGDPPSGRGTSAKKATVTWRHSAEPPERAPRHGASRRRRCRPPRGGFLPRTSHVDLETRGGLPVPALRRMPTAPQSSRSPCSPRLARLCGSHSGDRTCVPNRKPRRSGHDHRQGGHRRRCEAITPRTRSKTPAGLPG